MYIAVYIILAVHCIYTPRVLHFSAFITLVSSIFVKLAPVARMRKPTALRLDIQCLQLVRIRPYLYGIYVHCTDIRKLRFIIRKTSSRRAPVHPRPRDVRDYARPLPRGVSAAAAVRSLGSVVMVCRNLQMRATRVSLRSSEAMLFTRCLLHLPVLFIYTVLDTDIGSKYTDKSVKKY